MKSDRSRGITAEDFQSMVESIQDYAIYLLDPSGFIQSWNAGAEALKGYTADEIIGKHVSIFCPVELQNQNWTERELAIATETGKYEEENWRIRKDGSRFWASIVITKLVDKDGVVWGFCKITRDLTERRRQEDELRKSEERFRLLVEEVTDYEIMMLDPEGFIISWNKGAQKSKGYDAGEILGKHFSIFYPPDIADTDWPSLELKKAREAGRFVDEGWRVRKDGSRYWANVTITALYDANGQLRGFSKITRDLTDKQRMTSLEDESRRISSFIAMLAHELRNPLSSITNALAIMHLERDVSGKQGKALDIIDRQSRHLSRLVNDLLDMSRITIGKVHLESRPVLLHNVIVDATEMMQSFIQGNGHSLEIRECPEQVWIEGDHARLVQILGNLLHNAAKFMPAGGLIQVELSVDGDDAVLTVRDNGPGIDPDRLPTLFKRFEQSDDDVTKTLGGLGLGLSLVQELTQMQKGTVTGTSSGVAGEGAFFTLRFPRMEAEAMNEPDADVGPSRTILIVDDNRDAADTLCTLLGTLGYACKTAYFGQEAVDMAKRERPAIVILDIGLPDIDGIEVANKIRSEITHPPQLIALTGYNQDRDRERSFNAGFFAHLTKPVDLGKLQFMLNYLLAS